MENLCVPRHMTWPAHDLLCWQLSRCVILGTVSRWVRWHIPVPCATIMASLIKIIIMIMPSCLCASSATYGCNLYANGFIELDHAYWLLIHQQGVKGRLKAAPMLALLIRPSLMSKSHYGTRHLMAPHQYRCTGDVCTKQTLS